MYFDDRVQAGNMLANSLHGRFGPEECAIVALSEGGVIVGAQVASALRCVMLFVLSRPVEIPGESLDLGMVDESGGFTYNSELADIEIKEYGDEFHGYVDEKKREALTSINREIGNGGIWDEKLLTDKTVILIDDGLEDTTGIDVAMNLLKPVRIKKLIISAPIINVDVVDHLHILADELLILDVRDNFLGTDHYYTDNKTLSTKEAVEYVSKIVKNWS